MDFASYNAFRVNLQWLIEGEELTGTFSTDSLDLMIGLGEERVYHGDAMTAGLRASSMLDDLSVAVANNAAPLPADLMELKEVYFDGEPSLDIIGLDRLRAMEAGDDATGAKTRYAAQDGDSLRFWPVASGTLLGSYYTKPEALKTVTWADATTLARYPALFLYACLYECALFLGMDSKMGVWESRYRQLASGANHSEQMRAFAGGPLKVRTR